MDMQWNPALIIMNVAYALTLAGLAVRNILILRLLMISAQVILITTGLILGNVIIVFWNCIFIIINLIQIIILFKEKKPVRIPERFQDIYKDKFSHLSERDFLKLWALGEDRIFLGGFIMKEGEYRDSVYIIIEGQAVVKNNLNTVAILGRGDFIGEMGFISGHPASADVVSDDRIVLRSWKRKVLFQLKEKDHNLWIKIQQAMGHDLIVKVKRLKKHVPQKRGI